MDTQAFTKALTEFFTTVIEEYEDETDLDVDRDLLLTMLNCMFWDPVTLGQPSNTVSIFARVQEALKLVFCHNVQQVDLDLAAVKTVLPEWPTIFSDILNTAVRVLLPTYSPDFDIWEFAGPSMTLDKFLTLLDMHMRAYAHIHEIENVVISPRQAEVFPKANGDPNQEATLGKIRDPNFYHRCMFCPKMDANDRHDAALDHMQVSHNYYNDPNNRLKRALALVHQKRKSIVVLRAIIIKERVIYNSLVTRLFEAKKAVATLLGTSYHVLPSLRDVQGRDLRGLGKVQVAEKLCDERAQLMSCDLNKSIRRTNASAWKIGWEDHLALEEFDWTDMPDMLDTVSSSPLLSG